MQAWLYTDDGRIFPLEGLVRIGRAAANSIVVSDDEVSRHHAMIHLQNLDECWLIDLGTINGTYLNGRRLVIPARLCPGDAIRFGSAVYLFWQESSDTPAPGTSPANDKPTVPRVKTRDCWLLLADIEGYTAMSHRVPADELARFVGTWLQTCRKLIDGQRGTINKYTGDGFLAYWPDEGEATVNQARDALASLRRMRSDAPKFRLLVHCASLAFGGASATGEEGLFGVGLNYLFRAEKLAAELRLHVLLTDAAGARWPDREALVPAGEHSLKDFPDAKPFYTLRETDVHA